MSQKLVKLNGRLADIKLYTSANTVDLLIKYYNTVYSNTTTCFSSLEFSLNMALKVETCS
jgi:hypothetical protein